MAGAAAGAAWVEYEALRQEQQERVLLQVGRGRQAARAEFSRQERVGLGRQLQATMDRYLAGWRSWFDRHTGQDTHQTVSTDAGVAARSVEPSPRCPDGGGGRRCRTGPYCLG